MLFFLFQISFILTGALVHTSFQLSASINNKCKRTVVRTILSTSKGNIHVKQTYFPCGDVVLEGSLMGQQ